MTVTASKKSKTALELAKELGVEWANLEREKQRQLKKNLSILNPIKEKQIAIEGKLLQFAKTGEGADQFKGKTADLGVFKLRWRADSEAIFPAKLDWLKLHKAFPALVKHSISSITVLRSYLEDPDMKTKLKGFGLKLKSVDNLKVELID